MASEEIKYESEGERRQIIISYLGSKLGDEYFEDYKRFAGFTRVQHYENLVEDYFRWSEAQKEDQPNRVWAWINNFKKNFIELFK